MILNGFDLMSSQEVFPKQQLKHLQAANAVIYAQREGFGDEKEKQKEAEEEAAMKRMQVESSDESGSV